MRPPVYWSETPADESTAPGESEGGQLPVLPEYIPTESPGIFVEQPLDRWSPHDLVVGLTRLVRWTGAAIARGVAAS